MIILRLGKLICLICLLYQSSVAGTSSFLTTNEATGGGSVRFVN